MHTTKAPKSPAMSRRAVENEAATRSALLSLASLISGQQVSEEFAAIDDLDELSGRVVGLFDERRV